MSPLHRCVAVSAIASFLLAGVRSPVLGFSQVAQQKRPFTLRMVHDDNNHNHNHNNNGGGNHRDEIPSFLKKIPHGKILTAMAVGSILAWNTGVADSSLAVTANHDAYPSLQVATTTLKTMDMALPSYDSISDAKASVGTVSGLVVEEVDPSTGPVTKKTRKGGGEGKGGGGFMSFLGSPQSEGNVNKAAEFKAKALEAKAKAQAEKEAEMERKKAEAEARAIARQEADEKAKAERLERQIEVKEAREKAKAEKIAQEMEAKESMLKESMKFVDSGLPSYSDSTAAKEKSVFSL